MAEEYKKRQEEIQRLVSDFELKVKENLDFYYDSETYEKIIKWYIDNHKFKLGLKAVDIALSQHNFSSDLLIQRANILIALQNFSDSLLSLERAHSLNPKDENIFILIGQVKIILGDSTGAIKILKKALDISDNKDEIYYQIGLAYQSDKKFKKASKYFKKAIECNLNHENALYDL